MMNLYKIKSGLEITKVLGKYTCSFVAATRQRSAVAFCSACASGGRTIILILLSFCFLLNSCNHNDNVIFDNRNTAKLVILKPNFPTSGEELCINITPQNKDYILFYAYFDCIKDSIKGIDSIDRNIIGCNKKLFIENDTLKICFIPNSNKKVEFNNIVILLKDVRNNFLLCDTSFFISGKPQPDPLASARANQQR